MISFDVFVNGNRLCRAGVGEHGVLSAITTWARREGPPPEGIDEWTDEEWSDETLELDVGGFYQDSPGGDGKHLRWLKRKLGVGDVITIQVLDDQSCDEPPSRTPYIAKEETEREREYYMRLKRKYEPTPRD
jgi:hypothetical protein